MNGIRVVSLVAALSGAFAGSAAAQKSSCNVNEGGPFQLTSARIYINKAWDVSSKVDERPNHLRNAVKVLTENPEKISNQRGRQMLLGRTLYLWTRDTTVSLTPSRGSIGYTSNTNQPQDLLAAIDSSFDFIEKEVPGCADSLRVMRRQLGVRVLNDGIELISANQLDSAKKLVNRSLLINPNSAQAYNALVVIAGRQSDNEGMAANARRVIELTKGDTAAAIRKIRQPAMYNLAVHLMSQGEANPSNKTALLTEAGDLLREYVKEVPGDPNAQQALARLGMASGDTVAVAAIYSEMVANPAKFTDIQLFEAASAMAMAKKFDVSTKLYEAGLENNPYYRDALFNLATVYFEQKAYDRMLPVANRLVQVDPSNPDNWRQLAAAHQGLMRTTKDAKLKKMHQDTLLKALTRSDSMPVRVSISEFRHAGSKHTLQGSIENRSKKAGNYTLKVEFIDKQGNVVTTEQTVVGPVDPNQTKPFRIETDRAGIVAFRYAPITD